MSHFLSKGKYKEEYFKELSNLVNVEVKAEALTDYITFENIRSSQISKEYSFGFQVQFSQKETLSKIIDELSIINDNNGIYILTEYSKYCGALYLNSICDFNYNFNFSDEHAGIISIISEDKKNEMILDFWEEDHQQLMEIEVSGKLWSLVNEVLKITS